MRRFIIIALATGIFSFGSTQAVLADAPQKATSLDDLLRQIKSGKVTDSAEQKKREQLFLSSKSERERLLKEAQDTLAKEQQHGESLEKEFDNNKTEISNRETTLKNRLGTMGELFGVIRQVAGDTRGNVEASLTSAQFPTLGRSLNELATSKALPSIDELEHLWWVLQHEMTESGKVVRFKTKVVTTKGDEVEKEVVRVGVFNAISGNQYLNWMPDIGKLAELGRQPQTKYLATVSEYQGTKSGYGRLAIDPSRGAVLSLLLQTPTFFEELRFGGVIGYATIGLGLLALLIALFRLLDLSWINLKVKQQRQSNQPKPNNPLGRIIQVYEKDPSQDKETLELKLDEAILRESSRLDRFLWAIKIVSVVAPLMGLLGTITGMIKTFQVITLFGAGDPKLMAGGISEALITTEIGLCVAIPLVLLHSWLSSMSKQVVEVLEEQSAGVVAKLAEQAG